MGPPYHGRPRPLAAKSFIINLNFEGNGPKNVAKRSNPGYAWVLVNQRIAFG